MAEKKTGRKLIGWVVLFVLIIAAIIYAISWYQNATPSFGNETNVTIIQNINQTNVFPPGERNWPDAAVDGLIYFGIFFIIGMALFFMYRIIMRRKPFTRKNFEACVKAAITRLKENYPVILKEPGKWPKYYDRHFGGDKSENPAWLFGFVVKGYDYTKAKIPGEVLVTCAVDAKTLEVFNPAQGRTWERFLMEYHDRRYGKRYTPQWAADTAKESAFDEIFSKDKQPEISLKVGAE